MKRGTPVLCGLLLTAAPVVLPAQENPTLRRAQEAYDELDFAGAITYARRALQERLSRGDRVIAYELLGYTYGALDSARQAVEAFRELIYLDPDREPDVERVSPRITSLYASALGQVLVVRRVSVDSASFVAGQGSVPVRFAVSRASRAVTRVVGEGLDLVIDSQLVAGASQVNWQALTEGGAPVPPGIYQVVVTAVEGRNEFAVPVEVTVRHGSVDTVPHLTSLPGYTEQPEFETPPRNWRPFGIALLSTGLAAGAAIALEHGDLESGERHELGGVSAAVLITGLVMSLKKPDPRPVPANILYNQLLREQLAQRNAEIASQNADRRRQVMLTIVPSGGAGP